MTPFHGDLPSIAGTYSGPCLVIGPAPNGWRDAKEYVESSAVAAISDIGMYIPKLTHWVTCQAEIFAAYRKVCSLRHPMDGITYHCKQGGEDLMSVKWPISGHYGLLGGHTTAIVMVSLGYSPVVLSGVPADDSGHFYPDEQWSHGQGGLLDAWGRIAKWAPGKIKSLSGNTRKIFGAP